MANFAIINSEYIIENVISINNDQILDSKGNESEIAGQDYCRRLYGESFLYKQTSYNNRIRRHYASVGGTYDPARDIFIPPCPGPGYIYDEDRQAWVADGVVDAATECMTFTPSDITPDIANSISEAIQNNGAEHLPQSLIEAYTVYTQTVNQMVESNQDL